MLLFYLFRRDKSTAAANKFPEKSGSPPEVRRWGLQNGGEGSIMGITTKGSGGARRRSYI